MKKSIFNQFIRCHVFRIIFGLVIVFGFVFLSPPVTQAGVKSLTKKIDVTRNGAAVNPFAVLIGDTLRITINYSFSNNSTNITDELYHAPLGLTGASANCEFTRTVSGPRESLGAGTVTYPIVASAVAGTTSLSGTIIYECKIADIAPVSYNKLPEPMIGNLSATQGSSTYYAGMSTSEIILNYDQNLPLVGFAQVPLLPDTSVPPSKNCSNYPPVFPSFELCRHLTDRQTLDQMVGLTYIDESGTASHFIEKYEISALLYPKNSIVGDAYNFSNNFAFYGRNLNKSSTGLNGTGYTWGVGSYVLNPQAQSSYSSDQVAYYTQRINTLDREAKALGPADLNSSSWQLQGDSWYSSSANKNAYPEGKTWTTGISRGTTLNRGVTYHGVGTIVIYGDLVLEDGASINAGNNSDNLGIIIRGGNLVLRGNNKIQAAIFVEGGSSGGTIGDGGITISNVTAIGSFVAQNFSFISSSSGIRFFYDYRLDSGWPPGFRYFNMPTAKNSAQ